MRAERPIFCKRFAFLAPRVWWSSHSRAENCCSKRTLSTLTTVMTIEVEKKFKASQTSELRLRELATKVVISEFEDKYYGPDLALQNIWLRQRNTTWEVKLPIQSDVANSSAVVFRELTGSIIWNELGERGFKPPFPLFAHIRTRRVLAELLWKGQTVNAVVDSCTSGDGFEICVGEIEVIVNSNHDVERAVAAIDEVAKHAGVELDPGQGGKLISYLKQKNKDLFDLLAAKGLTKAG